MIGISLYDIMKKKGGDRVKVNLSTLRPEGRGLLEVHPEGRFFTSPSKAGLRAAEWVNFETVSIDGLNKIIFLIRGRESINSFTIFYLKAKEFLINF